jgi:hypothetical protein
MNSEKTISATSNGIVIQYDANNRSYYKPYEAIREIQLHGTSFNGMQYQEPDKFKKAISMEFSNAQYRLYEKALYGLTKYTRAEIDALKPFEVQLIERRQKTLWTELNKWKNEVMYASLNSWFKRNTKKDSKLYKVIVDDKLDKNVIHMPNRKTFTELGIDKSRVAEKLITMGFLPKSFFDVA